MNHNIINIICCIFLFLLFCGSCKKINHFGDADLNFDGEYATALLTANIKLSDVVGDLDSSTTVELDEEGLLHLIYRGDFTQRSSDDIFASIPQFPLPLVDSVTLLPYTAPNGMVLEYVLLKTASITFGAQSSFTENISLEIELPEVIHPVTGETYKHNTTINYDGVTTPSNAIGSMNLAEWNLVPNNGEIKIIYTALKENGDRVLLDNFFLLFSNFKASYIEGYLGQEVYDLPRDTIIIDFFDRWVSGGITFADPVISMVVDNSFGLPVRSVSNVLNIWSLDGTVIPLESTALDNGIDFAYPSLSEVGEVKHTEFQLNKDNSNIVDLFSTKPIAVDYDLDALGNPDSDQSIVGFATDSSFFTVNVFVDLPLYATANLFTIRSDFETDFNDEYNFVDYIKLKIVSDNNIPLDLGLQLYFEDANGIRLDSLFDIPHSQLIDNYPIIKAADVNADGYAISSTYNEIEIDIPREKFDAFRQAKNIALITVMDNEPDVVARFLDTNNCEIKIGVRAGLSQ